MAGWGLVYFTALAGLLFLARFTRGAFEAQALRGRFSAQFFFGSFDTSTSTAFSSAWSRPAASSAGSGMTV